MGLTVEFTEALGVNDSVELASEWLPVRILTCADVTRAEAVRLRCVWLFESIMSWATRPGARIPTETF